MSSSFKIYTKTGDKGTSALYTGDRLPKNSLVFDCLGAIDEINANIGLAREYCLQVEKLDKRMHLQLEEIQARLIDLGSHIATPKTSQKMGAGKKVQHVVFPQENIDNLENWIDDMDSKLPPLTTFILPSGGLASSQLHVSRTVCRRAERNLVNLLDQDQIDDVAYKYINRLSDYLFMLARYCAKADGKTEVTYKKERMSAKAGKELHMDMQSEVTELKESGVQSNIKQEEEKK